MIRRTLAATQAATFSIDVPNPDHHGMPTPRGTGFFVSPDGLFVTAAHVVADEDGKQCPDLDQAWLQKEGRGWPPLITKVQWPALEHLDQEHDFALLRFDFEKNRSKDKFKERDGFPYITVGVRPLEDGEPVYSFGYPLPEAFSETAPELVTGGSILRPRVTSAIVAATLEEDRPVRTPNDLQGYVLDKALNYGNSGGPIVATETGHAHAFCSRFQPVFIPQPRLPPIMIPSLYGVVVSLANPGILRVLREAGAHIVDQPPQGVQETSG